MKARNGVKIAGRSAGETLMTNENFVISPEMVDEDQGETPFLNAVGLHEGSSGVRPIDTLYENTSEDEIESPRAGSTPTPVSLNDPMYLHRRL